MSVKSISVKNPIARKAHACWVCGPDAIHPGKWYYRSVNLYDGQVYTIKLCQLCEAIEGEAWGWAGETDDGYRPEDFIDWATEYRYTDLRAAALLERIAQWRETLSTRSI